MVSKQVILVYSLLVVAMLFAVVVVAQTTTTTKTVCTINKYIFDTVDTSGITEKGELSRRIGTTIDNSLFTAAGSALGLPNDATIAIVDGKSSDSTGVTKGTTTTVDSTPGDSLAVIG